MRQALRARAPLKPALNAAGVAKEITAHEAPKAISKSNFEVTFHPDYSLFDGRFGWNGWLLELPDPITKLVWDNAALGQPGDGSTLKVKQGDLLEIETSGGKIKVPAFIQPGQADASISLTLGYGKLRLGRVAEGGGFNVYPLRTSKAPYFTTAQVIKTGEFYELVTTQEHGTIPKDKDNDVIQEFTLEQYRKRMHKGHGHSQMEAGTLRSHHHGADKKEGEPVHHEEHEGNPKSRFQWGYDQSAYKGAGPEMKEIKRIALQYR